ncbi:hypothetical protein HHX47_DHR8000383 [Lentinula edodes]|nr:hypothetical protein HHX47_DHR8000383 [Lentinula edodes]
MSERFIPSQLDEVEDAEDYRPGGFHPMYIGDEFANGRYGIIHKLGFGRSSTVWLARDRQCTQGSGKLVTLKALRADASNADSPDLVIPKLLQRTGLPDAYLRTILSWTGPTVVMTSSSPHSLDLVLKPCCIDPIDHGYVQLWLERSQHKPLAQWSIYIVQALSMGFSDFTTSNLLFRLKDKVMKWSDNKVYTHFGSPIMDEVRTCSGQLVGPHAPSELVEAIGHDTFANILEENIIVIDFGQSYRAPDPPKDYGPATLADYMSPETRFEERQSQRCEDCLIHGRMLSKAEKDPLRKADGRNKAKRRHLFESGYAVTKNEIDETPASTMFEEIKTKIDSIDLSVDTRD